MDFAAANKVVHPVETQWHYPKMIANGFVPQVQEGIGFVRSYTYTHEKSPVVVTTTTGASSDYWSSSDGSGGYWGTLEAYVKKINQEYVS